MRCRGTKAAFLPIVLAGSVLIVLAALYATGQAQSMAAPDNIWRPKPLARTASRLALHQTISTPLTTTITYSSYLPAVMRNYYPYKPDFVITHVSFDSPNLVAGQPFPFSVTVYNRGKGDTAHGEAPAWFIVEVYIKHRVFTPAGSPTSALDHAGGFCSNDSPNCETGTQQPAHVAFVGGLGSRESTTAIFTLTFPASDLYDLYIQADTTWAIPGYTGQLWGQHQEEYEGNNVFAVEDLFIPSAQ